MWLWDWLRCRCCWRAQQQQGTWQLPAPGSTLAEPAKLKLSSDDSHSIEVKVTYAVNPNVKRQTYQMELFMFFAPELESIHFNFYSNLWQIVRLHVPKVSLLELSSHYGPTKDIDQFHLQIESIRRKAAAGDLTERDVDPVLLQLRLHACMYRQALRRDIRQLVAALRALGPGAEASAFALCMQRVAGMVADICQALQGMEAACRAVERQGVPRVVQQVWHLVDEFMLTEGERAFMKLLRSIDGHFDSQAAAPPERPALANGLGTDEVTGSAEPSGGPELELPRLVSAALSSIAEPDDLPGAPDPDEGSAAREPGGSSRQLRRRGHDVQEPPPGAPGSLAATRSWETTEMMQAASRASSLWGEQEEEEAGTGKEQEATGGAAEVVLDMPEASATEDGPARSGYSSAGGAGLPQLERAKPAPLRSTTSGLELLMKKVRKSRSISSLFGSAAEQPRAPAPSPLQLAPSPCQPSSAGQPSHPLQAEHQAEPAPASPGAAPTPALLRQHSHRNELARARELIHDAITGLQDERRERGYLESIINAADQHRNEKYTNRIKVLKKNARAAVTLSHQVRAPSTLLADCVGMFVAGLAMGLAVLSVWLAENLGSNNRYGAPYLAILVVGYIVKDRLKEWGKRYLQPVASKLGVEFPDRIVKVVDQHGKSVGECREECKEVSDSAVDDKVLSIRHKDKGFVPSLGAASRPERVLVYRKKNELRWENLDPAFQGVTGLDDVMRIDLAHFCRRMQPPLEPQYWLWRDTASGDIGVDKLKCARVYHINIVLRVRSTALATGHPEHQLMQFQRARVIMDRDGIVRLEARESLSVEKERRPMPLGAGLAKTMQRRASRRLNEQELGMGLSGHHPLWPPVAGARPAGGGTAAQEEARQRLSVTPQRTETDE